MALRYISPFALAAVASASCSSGHTCCAQWDLFIPVGQACVENEPDGSNNCKRSGRSKVPLWARFETKEWAMGGVCTQKTRVITRDQLEKKEHEEKVFEDNFDKYCTKNGAHCKANEQCYYDKRRFTGTGGEEWSGTVEDLGPACVCTFQEKGEFARANTDGTGDCVICQPGPNGTSPYVQRPQGNPEGPGAKTVHNGEFACAFGAKKDVSAAIDEYKFGPCEGPDKTKGFNTEVYGKTLADGSIEWWPTFRPDDISKSDYKAKDLSVKCSATGDFGYQCGFGELECRNGFKEIAKMCDDKVFKSCNGVPHTEAIV